MLKTVYFVDVSGSAYGKVTDFATELATSLPGTAFAVDAGGVYRIDSDLREKIMSGNFVGGGGASSLPSDPQWDDLRRVLLTDGDVPDSLAARFDVLMVVKDRASEIVRQVMTD